MPGDEVIAERKLYLEEGLGTQPAVTIRLFRPFQPQGDYPRCRYELLRDGAVEGQEVTGLDDLDRIVTSLAVIGTTVAGLNESVFGGRLRWEGSPEGGRGLGLPTIEEHWPGYQDALEWSMKQQRPDQGQR